MARLYLRPPLVLALLLGLSQARFARADLTQEQVSSTKLATALLITKTGTATTFCISESGLFVTCNHAAPIQDEAKLAVVIAPATHGEKRYPAKIVRRFKEDDLAVLQVELDQKLPVLELGDVAALYESQQVSAFGYPFGKALAVDDKSYPSISVNFGRITSLRRKKEVVDAIQIDAQVNPGNSGGPVLDAAGKVIGVVSSGLVATGINFAIPISRLVNAVEAPLITVQAPAIKVEHAGEQAEFTISVDWIGPKTGEAKVALELRQDGTARRVDAEKGADGKYKARIAPVASGPKKAGSLQIALEFAHGKLTGSVQNLPLTVEGAPKTLSAFPKLQYDGARGGFLAEGKWVGALPELAALRVDVGGAEIMADARKATRVEIQQPALDLPAVTYQAIVTTAAKKEYPSGEKPLDLRVPESPPSPLLEGKVDLAGHREIALPGAVSEVESAQNGGVLLLHLKELKKLAVFDVLSLKIRGYIDLGEEQVLFAGGSRYILVLKPTAQVIERYSVETLSMEKRVSQSYGEVSSLTMGRSASSVALLVAGSAQSYSAKMMAFDVNRMTLLATADPQSVSRLNGGGVVRASADGRVFGLYRLGTSPSGFSILTYRDGVFSSFYEHTSPGLLVPNDDGSQIFTSQAGVFTNKYVALLPSSGNWLEGTTYIPSYHPLFFLGVPYGERGERNSKVPKTVGIYLNGTTQALLQMPEELKEMQPKNQESHGLNRDPLTLDKRYHFYPQAKLLLTLPPTNDKLVARPLDVRQLLDDKKIDYLYVTSIAPPAHLSSPYHYRLEAASRAGGIKFLLQTGPTGLAVSAEGEVTWNAPATPAEETVIVTLKDAAGQEGFHTFHLSVVE